MLYRALLIILEIISALFQSHGTNSNTRCTYRVADFYGFATFVKKRNCIRNHPRVVTAAVIIQTDMHFVFIAVS